MAASGGSAPALSSSIAFSTVRSPLRLAITTGGRPPTGRNVGAPSGASPSPAAALTDRNERRLRNSDLGRGRTGRCRGAKRKRGAAVRARASLGPQPNRNAADREESTSDGPTDGTAPTPEESETELPPVWSRAILRAIYAEGPARTSDARTLFREGCITMNF